MINPKIYNILLDLQNSNYSTDIKLKQGDRDSNLFKFKLTQNNQPYDLTGLSVVGYFTRPDKSESFLTGVITAATTGEVQVLLTDQVLNLIGVSSCELKVFGTAGEALSSMSFNYQVLKSANYTALESHSEFNALVDAISELTDIRNEFDQILAGSTDGDEVINARGTYGTLKQRLDDSDTKKVPATRKVAGKPLTADITLAKADVGLDKVDNTSDASKPVSTPQAEALGLKVDKLTKVNGKALNADVAIGAVDIAIADQGAYYPTDNIEAALQNAGSRIVDLESRSIKTYGARRTLNATSPLLERTLDAVGKVANVPTDDGAAVNDFDNIFPWSHIKECKRDSLGRVHYKGDPGYDLVTGDWLVEIPKFYIRMERTATTFDRIISGFKRAGFWVPSVFKRAGGTECDKIYAGRFKTSIVDAVHVSRPNIVPENNRDLAGFRTGAKAKGVGWQLIDLSYKTEVLDMLYLVESGTFNSQVYLGNGLTSFRYAATDLAQIAETAVNRIVITNTMATNYNVGETICIGTFQGAENIAFDRTITAKNQLDITNTEIVFDGAPVNIAVGNVLWQGAQKQGQTVNLTKPNGKLSGVSGRTSNKYRGMEDIFGNVYEWVDGVLISERIAQICRDPAKYASTLTADYKPANYVNLATDGYPLEMGYDSNFPEALFPITAGGGTTTGLCDYYYQNTGLRGASFGGGASYGSGAGLFFWILNGTPTAAGWHFGSRLLFKPPV